MTSDDPLYQTSADGASNTAGDQAGLRRARAACAGLAVEAGRTSTTTRSASSRRRATGQASAPSRTTASVETLEIYLRPSPRGPCCSRSRAPIRSRRGRRSRSFRSRPRTGTRPERAPPETRARCVSRQHTLESLARPPASLFLFSGTCPRRSRSRATTTPRHGDKKFNVIAATLLSADKDYGEYGPNKDGAPGYVTVSYPFISLDDPDDDKDAMACPRGMYGFYTDVADTNPLYNDYYGCIKCEPGTYAEENVDKLSCRQCPPGTFGIQVGSVGVQASTDWRGKEIDPGCMPCPNGTLQRPVGPRERASCATRRRRRAASARSRRCPRTSSRGRGRRRRAHALEGAQDRRHEAAPAAAVPAADPAVRPLQPREGVVRQDGRRVHRHRVQRGELPVRHAAPLGPVHHLPVLPASRRSSTGCPSTGPRSRRSSRRSTSSTRTTTTPTPRRRTRAARRPRPTATSSRRRTRSCRR